MPALSNFSVASAGRCVAAALAAWPLSAAALQPGCSWNAPGHDPFIGDVVAAVDAYQDIPAVTRARLQQRMARRAYDEVVRIRRDGIEGRESYRSEIRDMHFGTGRRCATVDRSAWPATAEERGLVYCEAGHCILVPTVCRNVSRIRRADAGRVAAADLGAARPVEPVADGGAPGGLGPAVALGDGPGIADLADTAALPLSQVVPAAAAADAGAVAPRSGPGAGADMVAPVAPSFDGLSRWPDGDWLPGAAASAVTPPAAPVPEPAAPLLWLTGLALLVALRRRSRRA